jgi:hypothetical protein
VSKEREERTFENKTHIELRISLSPFLARGKGVVLFTYPTYVLEENPNKRLRERRERERKKEAETRRVELDQ